MWTFLENAGRQKCKPLLWNVNFILDVIIVLVANLWRRRSERQLCIRIAPKRRRPVFNALLASFLWCVLFGPCEGSRRKISFTLLAPEVPPEDEERLNEILPTVRIGLEFVSDPKTGKLPSHMYDLGLHYRDTNGSATTGPLAAFELKDQTDVFLGPVNDYVVAPIARYADVWKIPVITARAQVSMFSHKDLYRMLTRMMGSYNMLADAIKMIMTLFHWSHAAMLFHNNEDNSAKGHAKCYFAGAAIFHAIGREGNYHHSMNSTITYSNLKTVLLDASRKARIIIICAEKTIVRQILLAAEELNMIDNGEYVFFSVELYRSFKFIGSKPWFDANDTDDRNARARKAFSALLVVTPKMPDSETYRNFSMKVKERAREYSTNISDNTPVSPFVTAFYDGILLYAIALNETIESGGSPRDGLAVTKRMANRRFEGVTGYIYMDENGTRLIDFSLLDLNPESGEFHIVAHYISANKSLEFLPDGNIHWSGGRKNAPPDTPECGFDGSLCADYDKLMFWVLVGLAFWAMVASMVISIVIYRTLMIHYSWRKTGKPKISDSGKPKMSVGEVHKGLFELKKRWQRKTINRKMSLSRITLLRYLENERPIAVDEIKYSNR